MIESSEILKKKTMKGVSEWALVAKPVAWFVSNFGTIRFIQFQSKIY